MNRLLLARKRLVRGVIEAAEVARESESRKTGRADWFERREMQMRTMKSDSQIEKEDACAAIRCLQVDSAGDKGSAAAAERGEAGGRGRTGRKDEEVVAAAAKPAHAEGATAPARDACSPEDR